MFGKIIIVLYKSAGKLKKRKEKKTPKIISKRSIIQVIKYREIVKTVKTESVEKSSVLTRFPS